MDHPALPSLTRRSAAPRFGQSSRLGLASGAALLAALAGCDPTVPEESAPAPVTGVQETAEQAFTGGAIEGHEVLLRYGVQRAAEALPPLVRDNGAVARLFAPIDPREQCNRTANPLILGNCATDKPDAKMQARYGVQVSGRLQWGKQPALQNLHFLRNHLGDGSLESARLACVGARAAVVAATLDALAALRAGDGAEAAYLAGHATHTIQDSFSRAHARREGQGLTRLSEVCSYGRRSDGVCYHPVIDLEGDSVWEPKQECYRLEKMTQFSCLRAEAQAAVAATSGYLQLVARLAARDARDSREVGSALGQLFDAPSADGTTGFLSCAGLSDAPAKSSEL